jgi:hypothetical protein
MEVIMFITLLAVTFLLAVAVTTIVGRLFQRSISGILERIFIPELAAAWHRYMTYAIYVVGISGGVRIWALEKYIAPGGSPFALTRDRWVLEVYRTIIGALQSTAWLLLAFFLVGIVTYGIVRLANRGAAAAA